MLYWSTSCQLYAIHEVFRPRGREREKDKERNCKILFYMRYTKSCTVQNFASCEITSSLLPLSLSHFKSDSTMNLKAVPCNKLTNSTLLFMTLSTISKNSGYVILPCVPVLITYSTLGSGWDGVYSFQGSYSVLSGCSLTLCSLSRIGRERYCLRM